MKKIITICLLVLMVSSVTAQSGKKIVILHTKDLHSRFTVVVKKN